MSSAGSVGDPMPVMRVAETVLPTSHGSFRMVGYRGAGGDEHVTLSIGVEDGVPPATPPLVRLHSECLTGDALGSQRCDCGRQLDAALARIAGEGIGVLVYVRGHEGRGIGLLEKLKAYRLQDAGADTVDANLLLGHPSDAREYDEAAAILLDLGVTNVRLMSSNPAKDEALRALGIQVAERTGMFVPDVPHSVAYLATKRARMGHDTPPASDGSAWPELVAGRVPVSVHTAVDRDLVDRYGPLVADDAKQVYAQMAQSLDGFIATRDGDGAQLSGPEDHEHLHRLRALADAVVVGAGTVTADDPALTVREVPGPNPLRVVIDPHSRIPRGARLLVDPEAPTLWLTGADDDAEPAPPRHLDPFVAQGIRTEQPGCSAASSWRLPDSRRRRGQHCLPLPRRGMPRPALPHQRAGAPRGRHPRSARPPGDHGPVGSTARVTAVRSRRGHVHRNRVLAIRRPPRSFGPSAPTTGAGPAPPWPPPATGPVSPGRRRMP